MCIKSIFLFFLGMVLIIASHTMPRTSVHSSSGTLSDIIPWVYLSLTLNNHKGFELGPYLNGLVVFPTFFKSEFGNKELMVWATVSSRSCFCWLYILWPSDAKSWLIRKDPDAGKDWRQEEKGTREDEMVGWHDWLHGHEFEQASRVGDRQGSLACCSPWGHKESNMTEQLNWTEIYFNLTEYYMGFSAESVKNPPAVQETACNAGFPCSIPGSGRSPGGENCNLFQYSYLENPKDRGAWWATVNLMNFTK